MLTRWFISRASRKMEGPFTARKLREMAATGYLLPDDRIRMDGNEKVVRARSIDGLFAPPAVDEP